MRGYITAVLLCASLNPTVGVSSSNFNCTNLFLNNGRDTMTTLKKNNIDQILTQYLSNSLNAKLVLKNDTKVFISTANPEDIKPVTKLIHNAFEVWKQKGLDLSPMHQTSAQTQEHLIGKGLVVKDAYNQIIATVSFEIGHIQPTINNFMFYEGDQTPVPYSRESDKDLDGAHFLIFKKLAVLPNYSRSGLGKAILHLAGVIAHQYHFNGIILETVQDADWLYDWYLNENFKIIGTYTYPSRPLQTVLMLKSFNDEAVK